jgi:hypothetical protein
MLTKPVPGFQLQMEPRRILSQSSDESRQERSLMQVDGRYCDGRRYLGRIESPTPG